jgi:hypothetical protein
MNTQPPEQNPNDYDEVTRLRLQLHHAEAQRDAFAAALKTDVLKIAKVAIYQASIDAGKHADADTIGCMGVELDDIKAENTRLKSEVELWKYRSDNWQKLVQISQSKVERLSKAGIAMGMCLPDTDEANAAYRTFERIVNGGRS